MVGHCCCHRVPTATATATVSPYRRRRCIAFCLFFESSRAQECGKMNETYTIGLNNKIHGPYRAACTAQQQHSLVTPQSTTSICNMHTLRVRTVWTDRPTDKRLYFFFISKNIESQSVLWFLTPAFPLLSIDNYLIYALINYMKFVYTVCLFMFGRFGNEQQT